MAKSAKELREQAKKFQEQAKKLLEAAELAEQKRALKIGSEVLKAAEADWKNFSLDTLKALVRKGDIEPETEDKK